jgi:hypothetical protein
MSMNDEDTDKSASQSPVFYRGTGLVIALAILFFSIAAISSVFAVGMIVIGISAGFQGRDTLICNRIELSKIDCQLIRYSFLGKQSETIQDVQKAEIRITKVRQELKLKRITTIIKFSLLLRADFILCSILKLLLRSKIQHYLNLKYPISMTSLIILVKTL